MSRGVDGGAARPYVDELVLDSVDDQACLGDLPGKLVRESARKGAKEE